MYEVRKQKNRQAHQDGTQGENTILLPTYNILSYGLSRRLVIDVTSFDKHCKLSNTNHLALNCQNDASPQLPRPEKSPLSG